MFFCPKGEDFNWQRGCMEREEVYDRWGNHSQTMNHTMYTQGFFAAVDVVHLMKVRFLLHVVSFVEDAGLVLMS